MKGYPTCKCGHSFENHIVDKKSSIYDRCMGTVNGSCGCPSYCPKNMKVSDPKYRKMKDDLRKGV